MSAGLPESIDAWRAVTARRIFEGEVSLDRFERLRGSLADVDGRCRYRLEFGRDALGTAIVQLSAQAELPLLCQRSLERFVQSVEIEQTLGLVRNERDEQSLPPDTEPVLVPEDGLLQPLELVEDELILALPVVPLSPQDPEAAPESGIEPVDNEPRVNPFAALAALKQKTS